MMEFLTFAPVPFDELLGPDVPPRPARWDQMSREAGIVSGLSRWILGLRAWGEAEREAGEAEKDADRRERRLRHVVDAEALLRVVELLGGTLDGLDGEASWAEWVERLRTVVDQWIGPERDRDAVLEMIADLGGLGSVAARAPWAEVEQVLEARFEWERLPLEPLEGGAVHVGALDAMAGLPFRVVAIPGLVEGGYPGVFRPDPFPPGFGARGAPNPGTGHPASGSAPALAGSPGPPRLLAHRRSRSRKASLLPALSFPSRKALTKPALRHGLPRHRRLRREHRPPTQDRLLEARRLFHRALSQATERLILSYPRADARTGRERLPSLFFAAAASTLAGRPLAGAELERLVVEDDLDRLPLEDAMDAGERDRIRLRRDEAAATAIAAGSAFFRQSRLASQARWSGRLTRYDGLVVGEGDEDLRARLDPLAARLPRLGEPPRDLRALRLPLPPAERPAPPARARARGAAADRPARARRPLPPGGRALPARAAGPRRAAGARHRGRPRAARGDGRGGPRGPGGGQPAALHAPVAAREAPLPRDRAGLARARGGRRREVHPRPLRAELRARQGARRGGAARPRAARDRPRRRPRRCGCPGRSTGSTAARTGSSCATTRPAAPRRTTAASSAAASSCRSRSTSSPRRSSCPASAWWTPSSTTWTAGARWPSAPTSPQGPEFRDLLRRLVDLVARGVFVQEPTACDFCDFTAVCGPKALLQRRQAIKVRDRTLQEFLRLRDIS